tara:strand:- start:20915 stop:21250 length:336 start_codon:yes stop_codon:yes gene_type:complete
MAKGDYTNSDTRNKYKNLVKEQSLTKVTVVSTEKRDRAELLDMVEELFYNGNQNITAEKLRAFCHILIKSVQNSSDDAITLDANTVAGGLPTSRPITRGLLWSDRGTVKVS